LLAFDLKNSSIVSQNSRINKVVWRGYGKNPVETVELKKYGKIAKV
jgi:hypothetical protein